ncbi:hypothetical protein BpHYR1_003529 [Brachionus plicatilis]|uniref:Integrase catalytic domain-containing protein n=1 Tax=Brachionus plicatilis TaxID=10195 RepID=A0A3M7RVQ6_BRAPC|nr:hypothetical protein BpHYR1_003529 [Brachionus plicatilis]
MGQHRIVIFLHSGNCLPFSQNLLSCPLKSQKAVEVADCLIQYISGHGVPEAVLSDRGTNFQSELMNQLMMNY